VRANLEHGLDLIFLSERGFSQHEDDPGGPTQDGVTLSTLTAWRKKPVTIAELKGLGSDERNAIFAAQYAEPIRFDELPDGLDYCVLDCSVNSGPNRAGRILQHALGMTGKDIDGVIGAKTLALVNAARAMEISEIIQSYCDDRLTFMRTLRNWRTFKNGWTKRVAVVEDEALRIAAGQQVNVVVRPALPESAGAKAAGATKLIRLPSGQAALATAGMVGAVAVSTATQATGLLQAYADFALVRNILVGLAVISAAGMVIVTATRAKQGATT
jgi:lysozyme family protein